MARKIKFALEMPDGTKVRGGLEELREHFDMEAVTAYFLSGKLIEWLDDRYYEDEAEALENLDKDSPDFHQQLCSILGVEYEGEDQMDVEALERLNEKKAILRQKTGDEEIIKNAAITALTQEDLAYLLDMDQPVIYLCGECFNVPIRKTGKKYIGILGTPTVNIKAKSQDEIESKGIVFENVRLPWEGAAKTGAAVFSGITDSQNTTVDSTYEIVPLDELKDLYKSAFSKRLKYYPSLENKIWEISDGRSDDPVEDKELSEGQKKIALRLLCQNKYTENDVVHVCLSEDYTSGWAFTKDAFCMYQKGLIEGTIIPYKDIVTSSVQICEIYIELVGTSYKPCGGAFGYGSNSTQSNGIANYLNVVKNLFAEQNGPVKKMKSSESLRCKICGYVYNGNELPANFVCPICHASDFE